MYSDRIHRRGTFFRSPAGCVLSLLLAATVFGSAARACPLCAAPQHTLAEEFASADMVVLVRLAEDPIVRAATDERAAVVAFDVVKPLKGGRLVDAVERIEAAYVGPAAADDLFLVTARNPVDPVWSMPLVLTDHACEYVERLPSLAAESAGRLAFFVDYLADDDGVLAGDACNEFSKASYADMCAVKEKLPREKLRRWVEQTNVGRDRRRLYLLLLSICGTSDDVPMLAEWIRRPARPGGPGLDVLIVAYLALAGVDGLPLVEDLFLKDPDAQYAHAYAAVAALRFCGNEIRAIDRDRVVASMRLMLDRPAAADLVIPDLARWEDWSVIDRVVELFEEADDDSSWVRVPVVNYLRACPLPEAKTAIDRLAKIDPDAVRRAGRITSLAAAPARATGEGPIADARPAAHATRPAFGTAVDESDAAGADPGLLRLLGIPAALGIGLLAAQWLILRGPRRR